MGQGLQPLWRNDSRQVTTPSTTTLAADIPARLNRPNRCQKNIDIVGKLWIEGFNPRSQYAVPKAIIVPASLSSSRPNHQICLRGGCLQPCGARVSTLAANPLIPRTEALASKMGLGRSQFYRKIKALTNYTPIELLRNIRLKRSRELLAGTQKTARSKS